MIILNTINSAIFATKPKALLWLLVAFGCILLTCNVSCERDKSVHGYNKTQWINLINGKLDATNEPLDIVRVTKDAESVQVEVAVRYNILERQGLLEDYGKIDLVINQRTFSSLQYLRSDNGNVIVKNAVSNFVSGTNALRAELLIYDHAKKDCQLIISGPVRYVLLHL